MQVLSREYGGRGGYTSEELHKIVTGKATDRYYIFPFVKNAPPEVNRILERTYRRHREAGDSKVAAAIAAWNKVKQAGYVKQMKPAPVWVKKRSYNMDQLKPMVRRTNYGVGAVAGGLTERGIRGLWGIARRHPRTTRAVGAGGLGYLTAKELAKRRKRKHGYQLEHFTPDIPPTKGWAGIKERRAARVAETMRKGHTTKKQLSAVGKRIGSTASTAVKTAIIGLAVKEIFDFLKTQRGGRAPWLPEIRPDIELAGYQIQVYDRAIQYAPLMPSKVLQTIRAKSGAALHRTKVGVERGMLAWLIGFISAELLSRGITAPRRKHDVKFPEGYRLRTAGTGETLPRGFHRFTPTKTIPEPLPKFKRKRKLSRKIGPIAALPIAALLALRLKRRKEGYSFGSAAKKTLRGVGKAGRFGSRALGVASNVAIPALILSELWPKKKKRLPLGQPPVLSPTRPYSDGTGWNKYLFATKAGRDWLQSYMDREAEMYPMKSKAQRRFLHATDPTLADEFEKKTPKGKKLPEKVKKHSMALSTRVRSQTQRVRVRLRNPRARWDRRLRHPATNPLVAAGSAAATIGIAALLKRRKAKAQKRQTELVSKHLLGVPIILPLLAAQLLRAKAKKQKGKEAVVQHSLKVPWMITRARDLLKLPRSTRGGKDIVQWARELAAALRVKQLQAKGAVVKASLGARATRWETVASQVEDTLGRASLERVGMIAAGTAVGAAGHEVGKQRERQRIRKVVG